MIRLFAAGLALSLVSITAAQAQQTTGPRLHLDKKEFDFGVIMHGSQARLEVPIENRGDAELLLKRVKPSCGCTVAEYPRKLAPGAKGTIELTFDSTERPAGYQSFRVAIYSNDPSQRDLGGFCTLLALRGEVKTLYRIAPHGAYFGEFVRGMDPMEKIITVTGKESAAGGFTAELAKTPPDYLAVEFLPLVEGDKRKGLRIKIRLLAHAPLGQIDQALSFATNIKTQPVFQLPAVALVNNRITGPPAVHFGPVKRAEGAKRMIAIERRDGRDGIPVAQLRYDAKRLRVSHSEISERRLECEVTVPAWAPPGPFATTLHVLLDDPDQRIVSVPVYANVLPLVQVEPAVGLLPQATKPGAVAARFEVRLGSKRSLKSVAVEGEGLEAQMVSGKGAYTVEVHSKTGDLPTQGRLILTTDVPGEQRVVVDLIRS